MGRSKPGTAMQKFTRDYARSRQIRRHVFARPGSAYASLGASNAQLSRRTGRRNLPLLGQQQEGGDRDVELDEGEDEEDSNSRGGSPNIHRGNERSNARLPMWKMNPYTTATPPVIAFPSKQTPDSLLYAAQLVPAPVEYWLSTTTTGDRNRQLDSPSAHHTLTSHTLGIARLPSFRLSAFLFAITAVLDAKHPRFLSRYGWKLAVKKFDYKEEKLAEVFLVCEGRGAAVALCIILEKELISGRMVRPKFVSDIDV
ncbi:hypothetical protein K431DRAFT_298614 [Polychaeton citri CBS 116435]|uniref:Uncharacterized protein n=1 Tax=Polychaeton citri CBS 116435 TaxID=1314669 RepID=A0A9P4Q193_9PEZI|nr:hypothetical protein K431DRAFT_298614 [Polychaeton citri CBS 116435]